MTKIPSCERIIENGTALAVIFRGSAAGSGHNFITQSEDSLQVGVNNYAAGAECRAHVHLPIERHLHTTAEVTFVAEGACLLEIFTHERQCVHETLLEAGDAAVFLAGGHRLRFPKPTRLFTVKQGPYMSAAVDKEFFDP